MSSDSETVEQDLAAEEKLDAVLESGGSLADAIGLDEKDLEVLYNLGYTEYQQAKYEDAATTFGYLCQCDHRSARSWMGLGATWQMMQCYEGAAAAYSMAAGCDPPDPKAPLHAAECLLALGHVEDALDAVDQAIDWAPSAENPEEVLDRAGVLYQAVEQYVGQIEAEQGDSAEAKIGAGSA